MRGDVAVPAAPAGPLHLPGHGALCCSLYNSGVCPLLFFFSIIKRILESVFFRRKSALRWGVHPGLEVR